MWIQLERKADAAKLGGNVKKKKKKKKKREARAPPPNSDRPAVANTDTKTPLLQKKKGRARR